MSGSDLSRQRKATLVGFIAVLMWALLALFTASTGRVPPLQLSAMTFGIAFVLACAKWLLRGENIRKHMAHPPIVWCVGVGGLFGYHFFYFMALRNAPAVEASLIAYLWPLLIVLFSVFLPGERLRWWHIGGAIIGLAGAVVLITASENLSTSFELKLGHFAAMACAVIWSGYSVLSRHLGKVPTDAVGGFCGVTSFLALLAHLIFESTIWPSDSWQWQDLALGRLAWPFFAGITASNTVISRPWAHHPMQHPCSPHWVWFCLVLPRQQALS